MNKPVLLTATALALLLAVPALAAKPTPHAHPAPSPGVSPSTSSPAAAPAPAPSAPVDQAAWTKTITMEDASHTPLIKAPASVKAGQPFAVEVQIGKMKLHPTEANHHVLWVTLYVDDMPAAHVTLGPALIHPKFTFNLTLTRSATLRVVEQPNHSAPWESSVKVDVK